ncbi:MAG: hypothetical protein WKF30_10725 [Pyrinomonadaceae bacterium]
MPNNINRREALKVAGTLTGAALFGSLTACETPTQQQQPAASGGPMTRAANPNEEYVWLSANANLPVFTIHDHQGLNLVGY